MALRPGRCLLNLRLKQKGMTQQELADRLGITQSAVSQFATMRYIMSYELAANVAHILGCRMEDLYMMLSDE